jgi:hypothetical protein
MADTKEVLRQIFRGIVNDKKRTDKCKLQFMLLKEYKEIKGGTAALDDWTKKLYSRFPQYVTPKEVGNPVYRRATMTTGDCFYSSIFRAAYEQGLIHKLISCLKLKSKTEEGFIQGIRKQLAKRVPSSMEDGKLKKGKLPRNKDTQQDIYDRLLEVYDSSMSIPEEEDEEEDQASVYHAILVTYPQWFKTAFWAKLPSREEFEKIVADGVAEMENWAGEIEVNMTKELLQKFCNINLITHSSEIKFATAMDEEGNPNLHLKNNGEVHWEYYAFQPKASVSFPSDGSFVIPTQGGGRQTRKIKKTVRWTSL